MKAEILFLGSGTSMGVPTLGCRCAVCTSTDPRNRRTRPSIAVLWSDAAGSHTVVIDTGPDFREQSLRANIRHVDAVFYTHAHADHILGMDDLRPLSFQHRPGNLPLYADETTATILRRIFDYTFSAGATYPTRARVDLRSLEGEETAMVHGATFQRVPLLHGDWPVAGFRFGNAAYLTDMSSIPETSLPLLEGLDVLILDALRPQPHPTHAHIDAALGWVERVQPKRAWFTHMSHEVDHAEMEKTFPENVRLGYDGLRIGFEL
ncbi:MAG TPA: MBL fold metallo-hydrolase [Acidobacteriaceae bacterium]|jgi:phosphoribosyl 1,2-cyclic phosphate phosphodiesterase|nr:MBL fold metallo-hydrolase [Acidobacteriaceae bacterium]